MMGPSVEDIRFASNTDEVNRAFDAAVELFGLKDYCNVTSVEERYRILVQSASAHESSNKTAPSNSLVVDVTPDGDCMWYCVVSILLGRKIQKDDPVISIFKKHFVKFVLEHRDQIVAKDRESGVREKGELNPNLISFSHQPYRHCCDQSTDVISEFHNKSFGILYNSDHGKLKFHNLEEWAGIVELPHTWGGDEILRLISCSTGLSFLTHNFKCGAKHSSYYSFLSKPDYGFQQPLPGGEILLQWRDANHYQILVPKDPSQLDTEVRPYKPRKVDTDGGAISSDEDVPVQRKTKKELIPGSRLGDFLQKAKNARIEKETKESSFGKSKGRSKEMSGLGQKEKKVKQKKAMNEEKERKAYERKKSMEDLDRERKKFTEGNSRTDIKTEPECVDDNDLNSNIPAFEENETVDSLPDINVRKKLNSESEDEIIRKKSGTSKHIFDSSSDESKSDGEHSKNSSELSDSNSKENNSDSERSKHSSENDINCKSSSDSTSDEHKSDSEHSKHFSEIDDLNSSPTKMRDLNSNTKANSNNISTDKCDTDNSKSNSDNKETSETENDKSNRRKGKKLRGRNKAAFLKSKRGSTFRPEWLTHTDVCGDLVSTYLEPPESGKSDAMCRLCSSKININAMGWAAIQQHASSKKHRNRMSDRKQSSKVTQHYAPSNLNATSIAEIGMNTFLTCHNLSPLLMNCLTPLCKIVFPDSKIASRMTQGATKATYGLQRGIAKAEQERFLSKIRNTPFSLQIDVGKKGNAKYAQHILRSYDESEEKVVNQFYFCKKTNYESSEVLAENFIRKTKNDRINIRKCCVQCQCDSCNVMRGKRAGFTKRLCVKAPITSETDLGGDPLHHLHNSSKKSFKKGFSSVEKLLDDLKYTIGASVKKMDIFQDCCIQLGFKSTKLQQYLKTRFLSSHACVQDLSVRLPAVKQFVDSQKITPSRKRKSSSESLELSDKITVEEYSENSLSSNDEPVSKKGKKSEETKATPSKKKKKKRKVGRMERLQDNLSDPHYPEMWAKVVVAEFCLRACHDLLLLLQYDRPMFHLVFDLLNKLTFNTMLQVTTPKYLQHSDGTPLKGEDLKLLVFETESERHKRRKEEKEGKGRKETNTRYALLIEKSGFLLEKEVIDRIYEIAEECSLNEQELKNLLSVTREDAFTFTVELVNSLQHYLPLDNVFLRKLSFLNPTKLRSSKSLEAVKFLAPKFIGYLEESEMEDIYRQWITLQADVSVLGPNYEEYLSQVEAGTILKDQIRIDVVYSPVIKENNSLAKFLKAVLCFSHGSHTVEGSINDLRNVLGDRGHSMKDTTINNRLFVKSAVKSNSKAKCCYEHDFGTKSHITYWKEAHKKVEEMGGDSDIDSDDIESEFEMGEPGNINTKNTSTDAIGRKKEAKSDDQVKKSKNDKVKKKTKTEDQVKESKKTKLKDPKKTKLESKVGEPKKKKKKSKEKDPKGKKSDGKDKGPKEKKSDGKDNDPKEKKLGGKDKDPKGNKSGSKVKDPKVNKLGGKDEESGRRKSKDKVKDSRKRKQDCKDEDIKKRKFEYNKEHPFGDYKIPKSKDASNVQPKITQFLRVPNKATEDGRK